VLTSLLALGLLSLHVNKQDLNFIIIIIVIIIVLINSCITGILITNIITINVSNYCSYSDL
jgi:hypothetical protein